MVRLSFAALGASAPLFAEAEPQVMSSTYRKSRIVVAQADTAQPAEAEPAEAEPAETRLPATSEPPAKPETPAPELGASSEQAPAEAQAETKQEIPAPEDVVEMERIQVEGAQPKQRSRPRQAAKRTAAAPRAAPPPPPAQEPVVVEPATPAETPVVVEPATPAETPVETAPVASEETAEGPVQGYVATRSSTATKTDTPLAQTPQSITVVTADQIRDRGVTTLEQAVSYTPSTFGSPYGFDGRGDYPIVRGSQATQFLDGLKRSFYFYDFGKPDPYNLERIEVLRGPSSMLYGQHTTGGLINLISKRPQAIPYREVGVQIGSFERAQIQTDMTGPLTEDGKWLYRLVAVGRDSETQVDFANDDHRLLAPSLTWKPREGTSITILGLHQDDDASPSTLQFIPREGTLVAGPNGRITRSRNPSNPDFDYYETENQSITALIDHAFNDALSVHSNVRFTDLEVAQGALYPNIFGVPDPYLDPERRSVSRFAYAGSLGGDILTTDTNAILKVATGAIEHKVLGGFDYTRYDALETFGGYVDPTPFDLYDPVYTKTVPPIDLPISDITQYQRGIYIQDQMRLGRFLATIGARYDEATNKDQMTEVSQVSTATTHRAALLYETKVGLNPYVAYSEAFTPVIGANQSGQFFKPIEGEMIEAGFKWEIRKGLVVNSAVYKIDEFNRLSSDPSDPFNQLQLGAVQVEGFEIETLMSVTDKLDLIASYSYTDAEITEGDGIGLHPEGVPDHLASLWAVYRFGLWGRNGFQVGAGVRYVGNTGNTIFTSPSYTLFDAMLGYESDRWRWMLNGSNLEDERYITVCRFPTGPDCFYGMRRNVTTTLAYKF